MFFTVGIIFRTEELISNLQVEASSYFTVEGNMGIFPFLLKTT